LHFKSVLFVRHMGAQLDRRLPGHSISPVISTWANASDLASGRCWEWRGRHAWHDSPDTIRVARCRLAWPCLRNGQFPFHWRRSVF